MSSLLNKILGNLATRIMLIIYLSIVFITTFFFIYSYYNALALQEQRQYDKLSAVVSAMAVSIDGDEHARLMERFNCSTQEDEIIKDSVYVQICNKLGVIVEENDLSPMYTLVYNEVTEGFIYGVRSDNFIDLGNEYMQSPDSLKLNMETGGIIPMYETENGTWLSAFYPIKASDGRVVALLEADIDFTNFKTIVNELYFEQFLVALGVVVLLAIFLIPYARKLLTSDEKQKELLAVKNQIIEKKNKSITSSINYAQKIQTAMLPPISVLNEYGLDGFVLHKPKDIVAGDFFWIEKHKNELFFAVADCTGHGVPGAIMSILCSNALNRVVDVLKIRKTNLILDEVRKIVIKNLGKGDVKMSDGMDIALCRLNLKTNKLQYSGAHNPLYIYSNIDKTMTIVKGDRQPVGGYVKETPFTKHTLKLVKGDTIFLFSDGYADQFGGPNGKRYRYKPFGELLLENVNLPMEKQFEILDNTIGNWKGNLDQIDDICVMGVKV